MMYIGTDIVNISRLNELISRNGRKFLSRVFTENEQIVCNARKAPYIHYAGKFAAKEAVKKAILSFENDSSLSFKHIEIHSKYNGAPIVIIGENDNYRENLQVSISHDSDYATATAILQIK